MLCPTEYVIVIPSSDPDEEMALLEDRLGEVGLDREAFTLSQEPDGTRWLKFWEPDRVEALRILARLDGHV